MTSELKRAKNHQRVRGYSDSWCIWKNYFSLLLYTR